LVPTAWARSRTASKSGVVIAVGLPEDGEHRSTGDRLHEPGVADEIDHDLGERLSSHNLAEHGVVADRVAGRRDRPPELQVPAGADRRR